MKKPPSRDKLRELALQATEGPWQDRFWAGALEGPNGLERCIFAHGPIHRVDDAGVSQTGHDAAFITAANPQAILALLDALDKFEARCEKTLEALELIAAPKRADGTYNRSREACEELARGALGEIAGNNKESRHG